MFIRNNQAFVCSHCGKHVREHPSSSRNHCPFCLYSKHVDIEPGDRKNACKGLMQPIGLEIKEGKTQIVFKCEKCGYIGKNITAPDDDPERIIELSTKQY